MASESSTHPISGHAAKPRRKRRWPRILLWSGCGFLVLLALAPLAAVLWLRSAAKGALPQLDGDVHLAGLSAPVIVRRDAHGVPHIDAASRTTCSWRRAT
jgi:penicillin G amidase